MFILCAHSCVHLFVHAGLCVHMYEGVHVSTRVQGC